MPFLTQVAASATRWWLLFDKNGPFSAENLILPNDLRFFKTWSAGRHPPVSLTLTLDDPATKVLLCPDMKPETGQVGLVIINLERNERVAHSSEWTHGEWVTIDIPSSKHMRIDFVESPSWIALQGLRFEA